MALKIIEGAIEELGDAAGLSSEAGPTGTIWSFVRFSRGKRNPVTLKRVAADQETGKHIALKRSGRFAFYTYKDQLILCGVAGLDGISIAARDTDPAAIAADAIRLPAKRKIFWGVVLIPTIIGLFFAIDMIKDGRRVLREHAAPKRPNDGRLTRALKGQLYWPF